jgi:hypothetical protein
VNVSYSVVDSVKEVSYFNIRVDMIRNIIDIVALLFSECARPARSRFRYIFNSGYFTSNSRFNRREGPFRVDFMDP